MQRRVAELLIEQVHWFYPDLPETPPPTISQRTGSYSGSHGTNPSGTYTPTASLSSYTTPPPVSPSTSASTSSMSSSITEDPPSQQPHTSPSQTTPPQLPLHDALAEIRSSSPKPVSASPPIPPKPYKGPGAHTQLNARSSNPPSPAPRSVSSGSSTLGRPLSSESASLDANTNGVEDGKRLLLDVRVVYLCCVLVPHLCHLPVWSLGILTSQRTFGDDPASISRPNIQPRKKRLDPESPGGDKKTPKAPSRRAPPPPVSRKPAAARQLSNEEISSL